MLGAWHEVDDALIAYRDEQRRRAALIQAVAENRKALVLSQSRYKEGVADFLTVLDAERGLLSAQEQLAVSTTTVSTNLVALYKALGGGWQNSFPTASADVPPAGTGAAITRVSLPAPASPASASPAPAVGSPPAASPAGRTPASAAGTKS